jgi:ABC-type uncharacterized transport system substrate-binding protein
MKARMLAIAFCVSFGVVWLPLAAGAQQSAKVHRLGWLANLTPAEPQYRMFRQALREFGYVEGKNIVIEVRYAEGNLDRLPELARELVRLDLDLLFVAGDQGVRAAKQASDTIPILVSACDPLDSLVASIARPGGKVTGVTCIASELAGKRLQLLKEFVPTLRRVAVLYNPEDRNKAVEYRQVQDAARSMDLTLRAFEARSRSEIESTFAEMANDHWQGLMALADPLLNFHVRKLAELSLKNFLPAIYGFREFADAGGLVSYGASRHWTHLRAAWYVDRIFKGANPGEMPIEQATKFDLVINLRTGKALGISVPPTLLALADEVIE